MIPYVYEAISLFRPYDISAGKTYVGKIRDGGYVMADLPTKSDVLSFGVGPDVSFEEAMADDGRRVLLSDHTVAPPQMHERYEYEAVGVCGEDQSIQDLQPLSWHVRRLNEHSGCILKMDVEGAEWEVFSSIQTEQLGCFDQILLEVHHLSQLGTQGFAAKVAKAMKTITAAFTLFHVHANNCAGLHFVGGMPIADVLELAFVRSSLVDVRESQTFYPSINIGNTPFEHDIPLFFYPFLPSSSTKETRRVTDRIMDDAYKVEQLILNGQPVAA